MGMRVQKGHLYHKLRGRTALTGQAGRSFPTGNGMALLTFNSMPEPGLMGTSGNGDPLRQTPSPCCPIRVDVPTVPSILNHLVFVSSIKHSKTTTLRLVRDTLSPSRAYHQSYTSFAVENIPQGYIVYLSLSALASESCPKTRDTFRWKIA